MGVCNAFCSPSTDLRVSSLPCSGETSISPTSEVGGDTRELAGSVGCIGTAVIVSALTSALTAGGDPYETWFNPTSFFASCPGETVSAGGDWTLEKTLWSPCSRSAGTKPLPDTDATATLSSF